MARKKIEPIISLGNEDKLTVQKSLPLFSLWRSELTLAEFKILDTYLSRIDSHKPEKRAITRFTRDAFFSQVRCYPLCTFAGKILFEYPLYDNSLFLHNAYGMIL